MDEEVKSLNEKLHKTKVLIENLESRVEALERVIRGGNVNLKVEIPKVILEKKPLDVRIREDELIGWVILLVKDGFFDEGRTTSNVAKELMRRCWHPKDLKHVRPSLEHLTALGVLDRTKERRKRGKGFKWVYRKGGNLKIIERASPLKHNP